MAFNENVVRSNQHFPSQTGFRGGKIVREKVLTFKIILALNDV
jgi:hypothetical protein